MILKGNKTPLMYAARNAESPAVVELLLKAAADVNAMDDVSAWEGGGLG